MIDSIQGKKVKRSLKDRDKILQNKLEKKASEHQRQDESSDSAPLDVSKEELTISGSTESLDDLLRFDAQVLAFGSTRSADINNDQEVSESPDNQQCESSIDAIDESGATRKNVNEIEHSFHEFVDVDPESIMPTDEQQNSHIYSNLASIQNERISQLESELSDLKKMSVIALVVAVLALIACLWLGVLNIGQQVESDEQQRVEVDADSHLVVPVIDPDNQEIDDLQLRTQALGTEIKSLEKTLILPEDDISGIKAADETMKRKEDVKEPINSWAVNLNSYGQRWETDKKMEELKKKGIPAEMIIVNVMGERWFRIRVTGFKTKVEAESYAAKIKKTQNEGHAWVSKI